MPSILVQFQRALREGYGSGVHQLVMHPSDIPELIKHIPAEPSALQFTSQQLLIYGVPVISSPTVAKGQVIIVPSTSPLAAPPTNTWEPVNPVRKRPKKTPAPKEASKSIWQILMEDDD